MPSLYFNSLQIYDRIHLSATGKTPYFKTPEKKPIKQQYPVKYGRAYLFVPDVLPLIDRLITVK